MTLSRTTLVKVTLSRVTFRRKRIMNEVFVALLAIL
jgi:hypothetical protein